MNRLAKETSPYLRQHAGNPVDWHPWGKEALELSKKLDKPIFLSVGYSACHWCHVMEHESFADPAIAKVMNEHFVCIKVDREERPDLDEIYMAAVQAMTGQGGWPMSVWLTPDLKPFYGGTYFPPDDRYGRAGFKRVLEHLAKIWKERRGDVDRGAAELTEHLQKVLQPAQDRGEPGAEVLSEALAGSRERFDPQHGGFGAPPHFAPKFPHASELELLLRAGDGGDDGARQMALLTLDRMARGGMYDQLGGGFHRYSTDREWLVPHFEKMLYDNALLVPVYLLGERVRGDGEHARIARETLDYMLAEMQQPAGGFSSSQDADSEGVEGRFFVWSKDEFDRVAGADAALAAARWGVTEAGNWEHRNVLFAAVPVAQLRNTERSETAVREGLARARQRLLAARATRVRPGTDDKVLCAWNAMAIGALAAGHRELGDPRYLDAARRSAEFALRELVREGRCLRSWREGTARLPGYLEDHAFLADALLSLFECDGDPRWLAASKSLLAAIEEHFLADDGGMYFTADDHEQLLARSTSPTENSTPSGAAVAARAFLRGGLLLGDERLYDRGVAALRANKTFLDKMPSACASLVLALQFHRGNPCEIVIAGEPGDPATQALLAAARRLTGPTVVAVVHDGNRTALEKLSRLFAGKTEVDGRPAAYLCTRGVCQKPVTDPALLRR